MEKPEATIRMRLPLPMGKALFAGVLLFIGFVATLILSFEYQNQLEEFIGINLAQISIVTIMIVMVIPWVIIAWVLLRRFAHYGLLSLYNDYLTITSIESRKLIKKYPANVIAFVKIQHLSYSFTFKDDYSFNSINMSVDRNCENQLLEFNPVFHAFIQRNQIPIQEGVVL
ncbi:hypothetical protein HDE69_002246 [Pedobacter cryoconitis]|uniref:Uncharacterized protein n=1 Tax=Pedobacter cryoconitis TaxID=188932 RepID=A0A7W8YT98_9SPHI|nr:hypothetical protein [Pedobacter cryoconitis]MBB5621193.1 hypothetical protein [Pedobacter cryoconitis]MBB5645496.1 hypothetical protein [Pedobacter cryoconitis]